MIDPKAVTKALMVARAVANGLGIGKTDILDRRPMYAKGGPAKLAGRDEGEPENMVPARLAHPNIIKEKGGQWLAGSMEPIHELKGTNQALDNWIGSTLSKYVMRDMGTAHDPIRALAERGILHVNEDQLKSTKQERDEIFNPVKNHIKSFDSDKAPKVAKSDLAKAWEENSDAAIDRRNQSDFMPVEGQKDWYEERRKENPWLLKLNPNDPVHTIFGLTQKLLGFDHLRDELHNAIREDSDLPQNLRLRPESLQRMSVPQAVEHVHKINKWRDNNRAEANKKLAFNEATHLHKDYPGTDYAWYEINKSPQFDPGVPPTIKHGWAVHGAMPNDWFETEEEAKQYAELLKGLTDHMRSVDLGNHAKTLEDKFARYPVNVVPTTKTIDNGRQPSDPAVEKALKYEGHVMGHCVGGYGDQVLNGNSRIFSLRNKKTGEPHVTIETHPNTDTDGQGDHIYQIKGKANLKPVARYLPYVQDFVKSGKWGHVEDLHNTDLIDWQNLRGTHKEHYEANKDQYVQAARQLISQGQIPPRYMTEDEFHNPESWGQKPDIAKASGGEVDEHFLPHGHPQREANLSEFMEGAHPSVLNEDGTPKARSPILLPDVYADGGDVKDIKSMQPVKDERKALMIARDMFKKGGAVKDKNEDKEPTRMVFEAEGPGGVKGINVPRHMWEGSKKIEGMRLRNFARAAVYGSENRDPLTIGQIGKIHKDTLQNHFNKPLSQQLADEQAALSRLRQAKHLSKDADTLDESIKLDTVNHETDEEGRNYVGYAAKGVAGHALYTSGYGKNMKLHVLNTCPGQTQGCGGGIDEHGIVDTTKGTCFAPVAEAQYPGAAIRRACHAQAKHDPAMTRDWILAHVGSLRNAARKADDVNKRVLFRPNVLDETDTSSRYAIAHLNDQRAAEGKPPILANSYGKTNELHDPENGYYVTWSNIGPKTKHGQSIAENIGRDKARVRATVSSTTGSGKDLVNDKGHVTPPKNSYLVTDVKRDSPMSQAMEKAITHAKYWSTGRQESELSDEERAEGPEGHFGPHGEATTPDQAHYGHMTLNGKRFDYQKQHILHPRLVQVGFNEDGTPHMVPTDSRFKDNEFLPKDRFMTKNGKQAGAILMTTPTESTSYVGHHTGFTHHVGPEHLEHAERNNGEYEIDPPAAQEAAAGREYVPPQPIAMPTTKKKYASGGYVEDNDMDMSFPEQHEHAQQHAMHREREQKPHHHRSHGVDKSISEAMRLAQAAMSQSQTGAMLPASVMSSVQRR